MTSVTQRGLYKVLGLSLVLLGNLGGFHREGGAFEGSLERLSGNLAGERAFRAEGRLHHHEVLCLMRCDQCFGGWSAGWLW